MKVHGTTPDRDEEQTDVILPPNAGSANTSVNILGGGPGLTAGKSME